MKKSMPWVGALLVAVGCVFTVGYGGQDPSPGQQVRWSNYHQAPPADGPSRNAPATEAQGAGVPRLASTDAAAHGPASPTAGHAASPGAHDEHNPKPDQAAAHDASTHGAAEKSVDPLSKLMQGNQRYVAQLMAHPNQDATQRIKVAVGQKPFAVIVGCSDSRVPPEVIFDQGMGDLFVIRVAGNVVDEVGLASIEYAVGHLNCSLVVVLGHERCGAVHAAVLGGEPHGHLGCLMDALAPAVKVGKQHPGDTVENAVLANVRGMVDLLRASKPVLAESSAAGKLKIVGARYDLDTGEVMLVE